MLRLGDAEAVLVGPVEVGGEVGQRRRGPRSDDPPLPAHCATIVPTSRSLAVASWMSPLARKPLASWMTVSCSIGDGHLTHDLPDIPLEDTTSTSPEAAISATRGSIEAADNRSERGRTASEQASLDAKIRAFSRVQLDDSIASDGGGEVQFWRSYSGQTGEATAEVIVIEPYGAQNGWAVRASQVQLPDSVCVAAEQRKEERIRLGDADQ